ncbi:MAG: hypothetical protein ACD_15C00113G0014 [uncultured bacterium]|nr:MAG: hypothetical protein ACD_15C00113G0014 [uncultured bacterium]
MNKYHLWLKQEQQENGSFLDANGNPSVLHSSLILSCLNSCSETEELKKIKKETALFLLSQKEKNFRFSQDVNVNFFALVSLVEYDKGIVGGTAIAKILMDLIKIESQEGGPYLAPIGTGERKENIIDLATNSGIANFLMLEEVELPNLNNLFETAIKENNFKSSFFSSIYPIRYFISKIYKYKQIDEASRVILQKSNFEKRKENPLDIILALSAMLNFNCQNEKIGEEFNHLKELIEKLDSNHPFYIDENNKSVDSTPALNVAFYLELLEKFSHYSKKETLEGQRGGRLNELSEGEKIAMDRIMEVADKRFLNFASDLKENAKNEIEKIMKRNSDRQMSLMPYYMRQALGEEGKKIPDSLIAEMGLANIFFWTAFIIYDDFWDEDEAATPRILPTANLYARHYVDFFSFLLPEKSGFRSFFHELMDKLDAANTWETVHCRTKIEGSKFFIPKNIPDYGNYDLKFQPASGHILGPVALLVYLGYDLNSEEVQNLIAYFKNYLIAMQINDDAHDWEEDMRRGHLSTVVVMLLKDLAWTKESVDLDKDIVELKKTFWFKTIGRASQAAVDYAEKSRAALDALMIIENKAPLERFITDTENIAKKALKEQKESVNFIENYVNETIRR